MDWSEFTWFLTALAAVVVLLTRIRLSSHGGRASGHATVSAGLLTLHTVVGVVALALWVPALLTAHRLLALGGAVAWWVVTFAGLLLLARWLPAGGRHADGAVTDEWGQGPGLSLLAHVGMLVGAVYFTFVALTDRL
jgi:hypothetical protein